MQKIITFVRAKMGPYEIIAFVSGFALMAYELVASRMLAPSIGSSMYVWTSVIGVMIAALAVGYAVGGWIADKRSAKQDIAWLLLLSAIAMTGTLLFYEPILALISNGITDQRLQGISAAAILFMPASFVLGMISPYLAKLSVKSLATTGRSIAMLSALNSIGGIAGTFFAGFIFFSLIGSRETLILLIIMVVACSWLVMPRHRMQWRIATCAVLALMLALQFTTRASATNVVANIDTATAHYNVMQLHYRGQDTRLLMTGPRGYQSGVHANGNKDLVFDYIQRMADAVENAPKKDRIAIIGGGVFTLPEYLAKKYPSSQVDVIEIDPQLEQIAKDYFYYQPQPNIAVYAQDARAFLNQTAAATYDVILVDAYGSDSAIPFALGTSEYAALIKRALTERGTAIANIIGNTTPRCLPGVASLHKSYLQAFRHARISQVSQLNLEIKQNLLAVYSNAPIDWAMGLGAPLSIDTSRAQALTDNYAPVESLWQQCRD